MKVVLLRNVGDHSAGDTLDIKDKTVLAAWAKMKVIDPETVADFLTQEDIDNAPSEREDEKLDLDPVGGGIDAALSKKEDDDADADKGADVVKSTAKPKK